MLPYCWKVEGLIGGKVFVAFLKIESKWASAILEHFPTAVLASASGAFLAIDLQKFECWIISSRLRLNGDGGLHKSTEK